MMAESVCWITYDFSPNSHPPLPGGCGYYRCYIPMMTMPDIAGRMGRPAWTAHDGFGVQNDARSGLWGFDVVVIKLLMARNTVTQIEKAQWLGQKIVVDVDDWYEDLPETNQAHWVTDPEKNKVVNRDHYRDVIMAADRVTVSTQFLLEKYSQMRDNVHLVPNVINPTAFPESKVRNRKPVIGWVGGIPWRGGDIELLQPWLPDFLEQHDLMFHHAGHMPDRQSFAELSGVETSRITTSPMRPLHEYFWYSFREFDIGLVPLNDIPFNHAKSSLKGMEYTGAGIPFVAQGLPEYQAIAANGVGRVANTPSEWVAHMTELLEYKTRKRDTAVNLANLRKLYMPKDVAPLWREVLTKC